MRSGWVRTHRCTQIQDEKDQEAAAQTESADKESGEEGKWPRSQTSRVPAARGSVLLQGIWSRALMVLGQPGQAGGVTAGGQPPGE